MIIWNLKCSTHSVGQRCFFNAIDLGYDGSGVQPASGKEKKGEEGGVAGL